MIEHGYGCFDILRACRRRYCRTAKHQHGDFETARCGQFAVSGCSTTVLADNGVDAMLFEQRQFAGFAERAASENTGGMGQIERRLDRIDAADQVKMLPRRGKDGNLLASEGKEYPARRLAERVHGLFEAGDGQPAVALDRTPWRAFEPDQRYVGHRSRRNGICRDLRGMGMGGVDDGGDVAFVQKGGKAVRAAEAAETKRNRLHGRLAGTPGQRQRNGKIVACGEVTRQLPGFGRAAKNEYVMGHHVI